MKIVYCDIPARKNLYPLRYTAEGKGNDSPADKVIFPVNACLKDWIHKGEKVRIVLLSACDPEGWSAVNTGIFQRECNSINRSIGADIEYVVLTFPFEPTHAINEYLLRSMIEQLEPGAALIGDITYGPKPLPVILFSVFNFAEKYFDAAVKAILYGRVDFPDSGKEFSEPLNPGICDLTSLYYLNSMTNVMDYASPNEAVETLETLTAL